MTTCMPIKLLTRRKAEIKANNYSITEITQNVHNEIQCTFTILHLPEL